MRRPHLLRRLPPRGRRALPFLAAVAVLATLPQLFTDSLARAGADGGHLAAAQAAFARAPYRIGDWNGDDVPVPAVAVEMLRPNAVLSRRFYNVRTRAAAHLVVVHCSDARDMGSHYPPMCYPARGWIAEPAEDDTWTLTVAGRAIAVHVYRFGGGGDLGSDNRIRVFNFFVLPDGTTSADRPRINYLRERHSRTARGIGQVQVVVPGLMNDDEARGALHDLLGANASLLNVIGGGSDS